MLFEVLGQWRGLPVGQITAAVGRDFDRDFGSISTTNNIVVMLGR